MKKYKRRHRTGSKLVLGFFLIIVVGAILLQLPFCLKDNVRLNFLDALFISTSAVCVTGLTPLTIADTFAIPGRVVICFLMQLGGIGFAIVAAGFIFLFGKFLAGKSQLLIKDSLGLETNKEIITIAKRAIIISLIIEVVGAIWLFTVFDNDYSTTDAIGMSIFHSISAYNNAGLDIIGNSLESYRTNISINLAITTLIILGGMGFLVYSDLLNRRHHRHLLMHTKIVLSTTLFLIVIGTLLHYFGSHMTLLESYFLSVSARTAGFDTVPCSDLTPFSRFVTNILMFIGASPGSTGGGIKTTTFFTIILTIVSLPRGRDPHAFKRQINKDSIVKAFIILSTALALLIIAMGILIVLEPDIAPNFLIFEAISAFATVGLSCNVTGSLSLASKIVIMLLMFIGRLGPLTITSLFQYKKERLQFMEERIVTG